MLRGLSGSGWGPVVPPSRSPWPVTAEHGHSGAVAASPGMAAPRGTLSSELEVLVEPWGCF